MIDKKYITHKREPFFEIARKFIDKGAKVLDVGPGDGSFSAYCGRDDFFLLEGNQDSVNSLKKRYRNVYLGKVPAIPFENDFFDLIHCSHIVEHLRPDDLYNFLIEMNRTLKIGGKIVVSAPLLWEEFYNDLSHVKPYNPMVFEKYLCKVEGMNPTRTPVSRSYVMIEIVYRYRNNFERFNLHNLNPKSLINRFFNSIFWRLGSNGLVFLEKTGYTIVLQKNA
ncbi:Methyltransferase domain-containing protein [Cyclobacterium lianum]|uniref:Methyltransferase domain-containing protein n=1 Tax=Cyclobacterium lianum TaxID=388280 RepID=A0A1M7QKT9_9BACT|nr:class I SAM-dependent methyltransferase [Cyclobacterium lianum]SHN31815.1 Methyltransferase domain-containing protein [Cyclobacterium lianum]